MLAQAKARQDVPVLPFLLLATRAEDEAADGEYDAMLRGSGLAERDLRRVRLESGPMPKIDLSDYSGVILGGGPFDSSDPDHAKSDTQRRVEGELKLLLDELVARDFPFLGACYGVGTLGVHQGGVVDTTYAERIGGVEVTLTPQGSIDPVLHGLPATFTAFVGHKEAVSRLPAGAVLLASSPTCPVQMFRVRSNLYATQFHPELDVAGIVTRIRVYQHHGYFAAHTMEEIIERVEQETVLHPGRILANFVERYA